MSGILFFHFCQLPPVNPTHNPKRAKTETSVSHNMGQDAVTLEFGQKPEN